MKLLTTVPSSELPTGLEDYALVLCGGGAAGRWQAGVLAALAQQGVLGRCKVIAGTSVGGLNTGLFGLFGAVSPVPSDIPTSPIGDEDEPFPPDIEMSALSYASLPGSSLTYATSSTVVPAPMWQSAVETWEQIKGNESVYKGSINGFIDKVLAGLGFLVGSESILDPSPLYGILDKTFGDVSLEDAAEMSGVQMIISSLDLNSQREKFYASFGENKALKLKDVLRRTSAIPAVFKSVKGNNVGDKNPHWHVDGGVGANNPFVALDMYNEAFPGAAIRKVIIVYCYPDAITDTGIAFSGPEDTKEYKSYRDVILRTLGAAMNAQEQIAEMIIEDKVKYSAWDVLAFYPAKAPCDTLDFSKVGILKEGYDYGVAGIGWGYKDNAKISILDFLKR